MWKTSEWIFALTNSSVWNQDYANHHKWTPLIITNLKHLNRANFRHQFPSHFWTKTTVPSPSHFSRHQPPSGSIVSSDSQTGWWSLKVFQPRVRLPLGTRPPRGGAGSTGWPVNVTGSRLQLQFDVVSTVRSPQSGLIVSKWIFLIIYYPDFYHNDFTAYCTKSSQKWPVVFYLPLIPD